MENNQTKTLGDTIESLKTAHLLCKRYVYSARLHRIHISDNIIVQLIGIIREVLDSLHSSGDKSHIALENKRKDMITGIGACVSEMLRAQEQEDYLLEADYVEEVLTPIVEEMIAFLREEDPGFDVNLFQDNLEYNVNRMKEKCPEMLDMERFFAGGLSIENNAVVKRVSERLEVTRSGYYTFLGEDARGEFYFHGNGNPCFDGELFANKYYSPKCCRYLIFGLGLGYHLKALVELDDGAEYELYECSEDTILAALLSDKLDWIWDRDNIHIHYDPSLALFADAVGKVGKYSVDSENILIVYHPAVRQLKKESVREYMEELYVSDSSLRSQGRMMIANHRENVKGCDSDILSQKKYFTGKRVIIVAGGPSLDQNVELLKDLSDRYVILAAGTVYRKLMRLGIRPDYVMVSDALNNIGTQFEGLWEEQIPVLVLSTAYLGVAKKYLGRKYFLCHQDMKDAMQLAKKCGQPVFESGGSVATLALDFCIRMECEMIAFIGLDLAYTNNMTHAEGTPLRESIVSDGEFEREGYRWVLQGDEWNLEKINVSTARNFLLYQQWIEDRVKREDASMPVYDATEGGVLLQGLEPIRLKDYLDMQ